jgi:hypothetical protein
MKEKSFEKITGDPPAKRLRDIVDSLKDSLPDCVKNIVVFEDLRLKLEVDFAEKDGDEDDSYEARAEKKAFMSRLATLLNDKNMELGRVSASGGGRTSFFVNETVADGKTNWRRWVHYPEAVSPEAQKLLDRIAGEVGQQHGSDSYEKYTNFYREARKKGLLTEDEYETIHRELYRAANG